MRKVDEIPRPTSHGCNFAPSEIRADIEPRAYEATSEHIVADDAVAALKESYDFDSTEFFSEAHLKPTFVQAYRLLNAIIAGGDTSLELALEQPQFTKRERKISRHKLELIALALTAKPQNEKQRKQCSSHACVLKVAQKEGVTEKAFSAWLENPNNGVKSCRLRAAKSRSQDSEQLTQALKSKPISAPCDGSWLKLSVGSGDEIAEETLALIPVSIVHKVEELIRRPTCASKISEVLRSLADLIGSGEPGPAISAANDSPIQPERLEGEGDRAKAHDVLRAPQHDTT